MNQILVTVVCLKSSGSRTDAISFLRKSSKCVFSMAKVVHKLKCLRTNCIKDQCKGRWQLDMKQFMSTSNDLHHASIGNSNNLEDFSGMKENVSKKCTRSGRVATFKASKEKMRRNSLNIKSVELGSVLEPGNPKTDKAAILSDAVRLVSQLRGEAQNLKDSNDSLDEKIKEL